MDDVIILKIYLQSLSKAITDKEKKTILKIFQMSITFIRDI